MPNTPLEKPKRTYTRAQRPLDDGRKLSKGEFITSDINLRPVHESLVSKQNGSNVGFFGDSQIRADEPSLMKYYSFGNVEYNAAIIDEAAEIVEERYKQSHAKAVALNKNFLNKKFSPYNLITNNCQDFVDEVISLAYEIAKKKGVSLIWRPDF